MTNPEIPYRVSVTLASCASILMPLLSERMEWRDIRLKLHMDHMRPLGIDMIPEISLVDQNRMGSRYSSALSRLYPRSSARYLGKRKTYLIIVNQIEYFGSDVHANLPFSMAIGIEGGTYQNNPAGNKTLEIITNNQLEILTTLGCSQS
jgi:hypothetical protein